MTRRKTENGRPETGNGKQETVHRPQATPSAPLAERPLEETRLEVRKLLRENDKKKMASLARETPQVVKCLAELCIPEDKYLKKDEKDAIVMIVGLSKEGVDVSAAASSLERCLSDDDLDYRFFAIVLINMVFKEGPLHEKAVGTFSTLMMGLDKDMKTELADELGKFAIGESEDISWSLDTFEKLLSDRDEEVHGSAAFAIGAAALKGADISYLIPRIESGVEEAEFGYTYAITAHLLVNGEFEEVRNLVSNAKSADRINGALNAIGDAAVIGMEVHDAFPCFSESLGSDDVGVRKTASEALREMAKAGTDVSGIIQGRDLANEDKGVRVNLITADTWVHVHKDEWEQVNNLLDDAGDDIDKVINILETASSEGRDISPAVPALIKRLCKPSVHYALQAAALNEKSSGITISALAEFLGDPSDRGVASGTEIFLHIARNGADISQAIKALEKIVDDDMYKSAIESAIAAMARHYINEQDAGGIERLFRSTFVSRIICSVEELAEAAEKGTDIYFAIPYLERLARDPGVSELGVKVALALLFAKKDEESKQRATEIFARGLMSSREPTHASTLSAVQKATKAGFDMSGLIYQLLTDLSLPRDGARFNKALDILNAPDNVEVRKESIVSITSRVYEFTTSAGLMMEAERNSPEFVVTVKALSKLMDEVRIAEAR